MPYRRAGRLHIRAKPGDLRQLHVLRNRILTISGCNFANIDVFGDCDFSAERPSAPTEVGMIFSKKRPDRCFADRAAGERLLVIAVFVDGHDARAAARRRPPGTVTGDQLPPPSAPGHRRIAIPDRPRHDNRCRGVPPAPAAPPAERARRDRHQRRRRLERHACPARAARWRRRRPSSAPASAPDRCAARRRSTASSRGTSPASSLRSTTQTAACWRGSIRPAPRRFDGQTATGVPISLEPLSVSQPGATLRQRATDAPARRYPDPCRPSRSATRIWSIAARFRAIRRRRRWRRRSTG